LDSTTVDWLLAFTAALSRQSANTELLMRSLRKVRVRLADLLYFTFSYILYFFETRSHHLSQRRGKYEQMSIDI
jgi:hypothetical protein